MRGFCLMKKKFLVLFSLIFALLLGLSLRPSFSIAYAATNYTNFYVKSWNLDLTVNEDNTYDVVNTIKVQYGDYSNGKHKGCGLSIQNENTVIYQVNGKTKKQKYYLKVSDVKAVDENGDNQLYDVYNYDGYTMIELGGDTYINDYRTTEEDRLLTYIVSYKIDKGNDFIKQYDLLNYDLSSTEWPTDIECFTFNIHMPKNFDVDPEFYKGFYGANEQSEIPVFVNKETLTISSTAPISFKAHEGLTLKMELPEGYFSGVKGFNIAVEIGVVVASLVLAGIILFLALNQASKNKPVRVVEFYPPEGCTPCDCDYILNGKLEPKRMVSLILYWASKGYIKINNDANHKPVSMTKLKDIDRTNSKIYETSLFDAFFPGDTKEYVLASADSKVSMAMTNSASDCKNLLGGRYKLGSQVSHILLGIISFIPYVIFMVVAHMRTKSSADSILLYQGIAIFISVLAAVLYSSTYFVEDSDRKLNLPRVLAIMLMIGALVLTIIAIPHGYDLMVARLFTLLPILAFVVMGKNVFDMNSEMKSLYGRIWGFKHSITIMEKSRIERLLKDDPSYFYDVLPYAYALNVLDDFVKNFESVYMPTSSNMYVSPFSVNMFCHSLNASFVRTFSLSSMPKISTGGISGGRGGFGGGFSGGGIGGAGGFGR